jgi:DNA polymerase elongation subunit (family B)
VAHTITGWLFDLYVIDNGLAIWIIDGSGTAHRCTVTYRPSFYLAAARTPEESVHAALTRMRIPHTITHTEKTELYSGMPKHVLQVTLHNPAHFRRAVKLVENIVPYDALYNTDISVEQLFLYDRDLFPLAEAAYHIEDGRLSGFTILVPQEELDYHIPPLRTMTIRNAAEGSYGTGIRAEPKYHRRLHLEIGFENEKLLLEEENAADILKTLDHTLARYDPDIILTSWGDAMLMHFLAALAKREEIPVRFNRDPDVPYRTTRDTSYFSYGKIVYKAGSFFLAGRWHIDLFNSFLIDEADLEGIYELARLTRLPVQHQGRAAIGTGLSSLQISYACQNGILVPAKKREPEGFKTARQLMLADRGGLMFLPETGFHEDIAELDFTSMYPALMVMHNISPETINCACCPDSKKRVPELGYRICEKRRGLVPATLEPILIRRKYYKAMQRKLEHKPNGNSEDTPVLTAEQYKRRQTALKWILVTCFGYLGYKNARFGRIEAHETVNAFSRETLLQAKETAEHNNFALLHAIVDCVWLHRPGAAEKEYERLAKQIEARTGIPVTFEGIYDWILFPASKMDPELSTVTRYVGRFRDGEVKIRGIEVRRRDTPRYMKQLQIDMLRLMSEVRSTRHIKERMPELLAVVKQYVRELRNGHANPYDLVIRRHITQDPNEYSTRSVNALVAQAIVAAGVSLQPGESIEFIITDQSGKHDPDKAKAVFMYKPEDGYDIEQYTKLLLDTASTLLQPFGWTRERLEEETVGMKKRETMRKKAMGNSGRYLFDGGIG